MTNAKTERALMFAVLLAVSPLLHAHTGRGPASPADVWTTWEFEPFVVTGLFLAGALYASGLHWLRAATGAAAKLRREAWIFTAGWVVLVIALVSPVHPWGRVLFSAHMVQHELLMIVAAPLLVLGRPALVWLWALPRGAARRCAAVVRMSGLEKLWQALTNPFAASLIHALALWLWHVPAWFGAAVEREWVHGLQHASFLGSAVLFWQAIFFGPQRRASYGLAILYLFFTAGHSGALGALITFASTLWYPVSGAATEAFGLTAVEDQQLGGLIMWVPAGLIYVVAALALFARWLRESESRAERDRSAVAPLETKTPCAP